MRKITALYLFLFLAPVYVVAQSDSTAMMGIFRQITDQLKQYKIDTSSVPEDRLTKKIRELRSLRGGFNINEAIQFKMEEDRSKGDLSGHRYAFLKEEFSSGTGKKWMDNAMIWIYRQKFTYKEIKHLVKFYKSSAGQKLATEFPVIMLESLMAAQIVHDVLINKAPE